MIWPGLLLACGSLAPGPEPVNPAEVPAATPQAPLRRPSQGLTADLAATHAFSDERAPYEQPLADGLTVPAGVAGLSAQACGACHPDHLAEWRVSTHALAWADRQYQAEISKSGNRWLCLNCHTPLLSQQDAWPVGLLSDDVETPILVENSAFDADLRAEGITCAACHVRDGVIHGPGLADAAAPHAVVADETFRDTRVCERCHQALATYPGKQFICTFDTGAEWAAGPYPAQGADCASCHMPRIDRAVAQGGPVRSSAQHWWRGAGVAKQAGVGPPVSANPPGLSIEASWGSASLALILENGRAGHLLPTGDPERWVQVDVTFTDADGAPAGEPWQHRVGQTWEWWPSPVKVGDNRLAPLERRVLAVPLPAGAVAAQVLGSSHRATPETAAYHGLGDYPLSTDTHRLSVSSAGVTGGLLTD